jgi:hypothetical protein
MAKPSIICSLFIENLKPATRSIAGTIVGPFKSGLVHFRQLAHVSHALKLEENNQISIKTDIPQHIYSQLTIPVPTEVKQEQVISISEPESVAVVVEPVVEVPVEPELPAEPEVATTIVKPEWYLTWQEVEDKTKQELIDWAEGVEGFKIAKSKSAAEATKIAHEFLTSQFEDHVAE